MKMTWACSSGHRWEEEAKLGEVAKCPECRLEAYIAIAGNKNGRAYIAAMAVLEETTRPAVSYRSNHVVTG